MKRRKTDGEGDGVGLTSRPTEPADEEAILQTSDDTDPKADLPALDDKTVYTGELLKRVRESKGITLKQVFDKTRIGIPSLMAVEDERFADLPNARIYVRGFVRCLAQEIGLDPDAVAKTYVPRWEKWFDGQKIKGKSHLR